MRAGAQVWVVVWPCAASGEELGCWQGGGLNGVGVAENVDELGAEREVPASEGLGDL
jgi:hypothetical protein